MYNIFQKQFFDYKYNYEFCQKPSIASFLPTISGRKSRGEASRPW